MPAWSGKLTDDEISGLVTYIRSLGATGPPANSSASRAAETAKPKPKYL